MNKARKVSIEQLLLEKSPSLFMEYKKRHERARFFFSHGFIVMVFAIFIFAVGHVAHKETANDNSDKSESMGKKDIQRDELNHKKNIINSISIYISNAQGLVKNADKKNERHMKFHLAKMNSMDVLYSNEFILTNEVDKKTDISIEMDPEYILKIKLVRREMDKNKMVRVRADDDDDTPDNHQNILIEHNGEEGNHVAEVTPRRLFRRTIKNKETDETVVSESIFMTFLLEINKEYARFKISLLSKDE